MRFERRSDGSYVCADDPGEPSNGNPRVSVTDHEAKFLSFVAAGKHVLEIGTGLGVSTRALADTAVAVVTVDIDPWVHEQVWGSLPENVTAIADREDVEGTFDVVFIDGDHHRPAVRADIGWARSMCPRGLLVAHDAHVVGPALDGDWTVLATTHGIAVQWVGW